MLKRRAPVHRTKKAQNGGRVSGEAAAHNDLGAGCKGGEEFGKGGVKAGGGGGGNGGMLGGEEEKGEDAGSP